MEEEAEVVDRERDMRDVEGGWRNTDHGLHATCQLSEENPNARKRLVHADGSFNVRGQGLPNLSGKVAETVLFLENGGEYTHQAASTIPGRNPIVKRRK